MRVSVFFPKCWVQGFCLCRVVWRVLGAVHGTPAHHYHYVSFSQHVLCALHGWNSILGDPGWTWAWIFMHCDRTDFFLQMYVGTPACTSVHSVYRKHEKTHTSFIFLRFSSSSHSTIDFLWLQARTSSCDGLSMQSPRASKFQMMLSSQFQQGRTRKGN